MKKLFVVALSALSLQLALPAHAQFAKPSDAIKYRQAAFQILKFHFGNIGAVVTGKAPYDKAAVLQNAEVIAFVAKLPWKGFVPDSQKDSEAKSTVWSKADKFKECNNKFEQEATALLVAAQKGDEAALKAPFAAAAQTVKACHEEFKN